MLDLPFTRFQQIARVTAEAEAESERREFQRAAFIGWQSYMLTPMEKGSKRMSFPEWLREMGLEDQPAGANGAQPRASQDELSADDAIERANRIIKQAQDKGTDTRTPDDWT